MSKWRNVKRECKHCGIETMFEKKEILTYIDNVAYYSVECTVCGWALWSS